MAFAVPYFTTVEYIFLEQKMPNFWGNFHIFCAILKQKQQIRKMPHFQAVLNKKKTAAPSDAAVVI